MTFSTFLMVLAGLVALAVGGELLVRGAVSLAERLRVSPLLIGLTLVGFGTSTPELVTSIQAALVGSPGIAVGNVVGSNVANVLLILGLTALIAPIPATRAAFARDGTMLAVATALGLWVCLAGAIGRGIGVAFVVALTAYVTVSYVLERRVSSPSAELHAAEAAAAPHLRGGVAWLLGGFVTGLALTILGAQLLVRGSIELARALSVSETIIGLTIVAVGTSLPELVTSLVAARRNQSDIALGNIIGSNIYNILAILGITAIVEPIRIPEQIILLDVWVMLGATLAVFVAVLTGWRITRTEGALLLLGYCAYVGFLALTAAALL